MGIGKRIKELRAELHYTAAEIAAGLEIPVRTIGSYEREEAQPGSKFFKAMIEKYHVNVNWLLTGKGSMFMSKRTEMDMAFIAYFQETFNLTEQEVTGLVDILDTEASKDMVLKFIQIKKGNKEALDSLIYNLQGIKAIYG